MPHSIGRRIHRTVFTISLICLLIAVGMVYLAYKDMEQTMLRLDYQTERDFLLKNISGKRSLYWHTPSLKAFYVPAHKVDDRLAPELFRGLSLPFSGEVESGGQTYLVTAEKINGGRLYVAQNITLFERQEAWFAALLALICLAVIVLSFVLARVSSRRLIVPLQELAERINTTPADRHMQRLPLHFRDRELTTIATNFNSFLAELEAYIKREQTMLGLASHELRTPVSVISGALEIIEQRGRLNTDDQRTLERAQRANREMSANVDVVLKLARRKAYTDQAVTVDLPELVHELLEEFDPAIRASERVELAVTAPASVAADPVLVKMLLRNLTENALQHTGGRVWIELSPGCITISDQGSGLPSFYRRMLTEQSVPSHRIAALSGLGLMIVTLIRERLGWELAVPQSSEQGTTLCLSCHDSDAS